MIPRNGRLMMPIRSMPLHERQINALLSGERVQFEKPIKRHGKPIGEWHERMKLGISKIELNSSFYAVRRGNYGQAFRVYAAGCSAYSIPCSYMPGALFWVKERFYWYGVTPPCAGAPLGDVDVPTTRAELGRVPYEDPRNADPYTRIGYVADDDFFCGPFWTANQMPEWASRFRVRVAETAARKNAQDLWVWHVTLEKVSP